MATKLGRTLTYHEGLLTVISLSLVTLQSQVTNESHHISTTRVPIATILGRMVAPLDGRLSIKLHDSLNT